MPAPLSPTRRAAIVDDIRAGHGCNATARKHHVSPSTVSGIARHEGLFFDNDHMTALAAENRRWHAARARDAREGELLDQLLALPQTTRQRDGRETKAYRRLSYSLYDLHRHHDRTHH